MADGIKQALSSHFRQIWIAQAFQPSPNIADWLAPTKSGFSRGDKAFRFGSAPPPPDSALGYILVATQIFEPIFVLVTHKFDPVSKVFAVHNFRSSAWLSSNARNLSAAY